MKILMVCLGNICRSPIAEGILTRKIEQRALDAQVDSAGTSSWHIGEIPDERMQQSAKKYDIDISHLQARQFKVDDFDQFDRIYVMDTSNLSDVLTLARNTEDEAKVDLILNVLHPNSNKSVPDPYFGGAQGFDNVINMLDEACDYIADSIESAS